MIKKVQCLIVDDEPIAREILKNHLNKISALELVDACKNALEAFNVIQRSSIDLIFLDINMPDISGLSFAKSLNNEIKIIFTTAHREYAVDGFELQAVDYLLKPISFDRLFQSISKYIEEVPKRQELVEPKIIEEKNKFIFVRSERKMVKINFSEINYIESLGDYVKIVTEKGTIVTRETISNLEVKLPTEKFIRIHRSYIIFIEKIDSFTNEYIEINRKSIPISRSYKSSVLNKLENI